MVGMKLSISVVLIVSLVSNAHAVTRNRMPELVVRARIRHRRFENQRMFLAKGRFYFQKRYSYWGCYKECLKDKYPECGAYNYFKTTNRCQLFPRLEVKQLGFGSVSYLRSDPDVDSGTVIRY